MCNAVGGVEPAVLSGASSIKVFFAVTCLRDDDDGVGDVDRNLPRRLYRKSVLRCSQLLFEPRPYILHISSTDLEAAVVAVCAEEKGGGGGSLPLKH